MKILYVTTITATMDFFIEHIKELQKHGHIVEYATNLEDGIDDKERGLSCKAHHIPFSRNPFNTNNYKAYKELKKLLDSESYDIIHTHTPNASAIVRLAAKNHRNKGLRVFYTAHGFHFYEGAPFKNWLLYYPVEKWLSKYTDVLITINNEDYNLAKTKFGAKKIEHVNGVGLDINKFSKCDIDIRAKKEELSLPENAFIALSVGELNKNKNHEVVIKALAKLNNHNIYYLICGKGSLKTKLEELIREYKLEDNVKLLGYRNDLDEIYAITDLFIFPSFREGLSVALMEAMASGLPCIVSDIRGNVDLIETQKGGFCVNPNSIDEFADSMNILINNKQLREKYSNYNELKIEKFGKDIICEKMVDIYRK